MSDRGTEEIDGSGGPVVRTFKVTVIDGPNAGKVHRSSREPVVIGSDARAGFQLDDPAVSRSHVELTPLGAGIGVRDLGSRNGTFVGGVRLREGVVSLGSTLTVGRTRITIEPEGAVLAIPRDAPTSFGRLVGHGPAMARALSRLERASKSNVTVLLTGETGTGKELAARSLHEASARANGPYVVVDCAAVPSNLFEAELFGHERGAFTGAHVAREGAFELAKGGTLFIDEIGELALDLQPKLLRVLELRETKRVGGKSAHPVDVRVVAATHRDLRTEVNQKRFREDLYYRLAVVEVTLPPLRERPEDLRELAQILGREAAVRMGASEAAVLSASLLDEIARHDWPGNVRELRNYLERTLVLGSLDEEAKVPADVADHDGAPPPSADPMKYREARAKALALFERAYLEKLLADHDGSVTPAAKAAGVDRVQFYRLLWRNGLRRNGAG